MWRRFYDAFISILSGDLALAQAREEQRIEHSFTFPNFERSAERCGEELSSAGLEQVEVESFPATDGHFWYGWESGKAWDVTSARLWMVSPRRELLADWTIKPHHLVMYSAPVNAEFEVVEWNGGAG